MLPTTQRTLHTHAHTHAHTHTSAVNSSGLVKDASASMKIHQMESLRPTFARECSHALTPSYHSPLAAQKEQWLEEHASVRECYCFALSLPAYFGSDGNLQVKSPTTFITVTIRMPYCIQNTLAKCCTNAPWGVRSELW